MNRLLARMAAGVTILATPAIALAQQGFNPSDVFNLRRLLTPLRPPSDALDIFALAAAILNFIVLIAAILAILYLIWAGIQYITASTDEEKAKKARAAIYNAIIGIVVIVLSYVIIQYVSVLARNAVQNVNQGGTGSQFAPTAF